MKNILVSVSLWDTTDRVITEANRIASAVGAKVWLLHVVKVPANLNRWPKELREQRQEEIETIRKGLRTRVEALEARSQTAEAMVIESNDVAGTILAVRDKVEAGLVVMGAHGKSGLLGALLGDITQDVLRRSACPVLVVPMKVGMSAPIEEEVDTADQ